jgi:hypothetical protein
MPTLRFGNVSYMIILVKGGGSRDEGGFVLACLIYILSTNCEVVCSYVSLSFNSSIDFESCTFQTRSDRLRTFYLYAAAA